MTAELIRHLWQSTFFAVAAGLLTVAFRKNRAGVRYCLWLSASLKFFVPFALLLNLGRYLETWMPVARQVAAPAISYTIEQFSGPFFPDSLPAPAPAPDTTQWIPIAILAVWFCGFAAVALIRFRNWLRVRAAVRASTATDISATVEIRVSPGLLEPGVVGLLRPILLLPEGIAERLTPSELNAVLAHELCHIRRRDNLFAAIHMMVEAIFWFHPLVWWIGARLVEERERACDEEVLSQGNQPEVYADAILNVCKLYVESPLACVSGVSGAGIRQRIEIIMSNRRLQGLNRAKKLLLTTAGIAVLAGPIAIGLMLGVGNIPVIHAQPPVAAPAPIQLAQAKTPPSQPVLSPTPAPKFDVASIKPCNLADFGGGGRGGGGRGGPGPGTAGTSPGRLSIGCKPVSDLIYWAYITFADDPPVNVFTGLATPHEEGRIRGGQPWAYSDTYTIEAQTDDPVANGPSMPPDPAFRRMFGPMLRQLLEDRFQLKLHREAEDAPMYALTVAPGGFKLKPMDPGDCVSMDEFASHFDIANPVYDPKMKGPCGEGGLVMRLSHGPNRTIRINGTLAQFAGRLQLDRQVIDRTGISGIFSIGVEFSDNSTSAPAPTNGGLADASDIPPAPSIYTVLEQQLGLKLVAVKAPKGYIVIDRVERPSEN